MLEVSCSRPLRAKAGDLPIRWVEADVRDFHLDVRYGLIFARGNIFDFMLTRRDQEAMLARVREHLVDGGQFMYDVAEMPPSRMVTNLEEEAWFTSNIVERAADQLELFQASATLRIV